LNCSLLDRIALPFETGEFGRLIAAAKEEYRRPEENNRNPGGNRVVVCFLLLLASDFRHPSADALRFEAQLLAGEILIL
jgi:hypothetical protein